MIKLKPPFPRLVVADVAGTRVEPTLDSRATDSAVGLSVLPWLRELPPVPLARKPGPPGGEKPLPFPVIPSGIQVRFANAIWTRADRAVSGVDVAVGHGAVWVVGSQGQLWRVEPSTSKATLAQQASVKSARISAGRSDSQAFLGDAVWLGSAGFEATMLFRAGALKAVGSGGAVDIAAGTYRPVQGAGTLFQDVFRLASSGRLEQLFSTASGFYWFPVNFGKYPPEFTAVAVERRRGVANPLAPGVFLIREGAVVSLDDVDVSVGVSPQAQDLGVSEDAIWVVSTQQAAGPTASGNEFWRFDRLDGRWDLLPGWASAVDVDADGNPWVVDAVGRLYSLGTRTPGITDSVRGAPKLLESWDSYFGSVSGALQGTDPTLFAEAAQESRSAGAAATILLTPWSDFAANPASFQDGLKALLAPQRGIELLFCLAPIFSFKERLPAVLAKDLEIVEGSTIHFDHPKVVAAYVEAVKTLSSFDGFATRVKYLSLGNEVNLCSCLTSATTKKAYLAFCKEVVQALRPVLPRTKFGVSWTLSGVTDPYWAELMQVLDVAIVTYYAVDKSFQVLKPTQYGGELPSKLLAAAELSKNKPIVVQEVGMPSHPDLGGSDGLQADFADFVLRQWDKLGNRIAFLSWWQLYDYLYDPNLVVTQQGDATSPLIIQSSTYPKEITPNGNPTGFPFIPPGNRLPSFFYGPKRPNAPLGELPNDADVAYFVQQSVGPLGPFCKYLSTCGLIRPDGSLKESFLVWKNWTAARRVQS